jgi:hypothetical protein
MHHTRDGTRGSDRTEKGNKDEEAQSLAKRRNTETRKTLSKREMNMPAVETTARNWVNKGEEWNEGERRDETV